MLKIRSKDNKNNAVWLVEPKITIGRSSANSLAIDDSLVGEIHIEVLVDHENLSLKNLIPSRPVMVNGQPVVDHYALKPGDQITIGAVELEVIDPKLEAKADVDGATKIPDPKTSGWSLKSNHIALANRIFPVQNLTLVGRSRDCDICLLAAHLSRRHAQLQVVEGLLFVKDLGSANGTFVNGKQVTEARLRRGDELRFDSLSFGVIGPLDDTTKTAVRKIQIQPEMPDIVATTRPNTVPPELPVNRASSARPKAINAIPVTGPKKRRSYGLIFIALIGLLILIAVFSPV